MRLIIAEKRNQADVYFDVLGGGRKQRNYYELTNGDVVTWVWGHPKRLREPRELDPPPDWRDRAAWPVIEEPVFRESDDQKNRDQMKAIRQLVRRARCIVLGTDPDREGDLIWWEILDDLGSSARRLDVLRFLGGADLNPGPVKRAFGAMEPIARHMPRALAGLARSINDMRWGTSLTVAATVDLQPEEMQRRQRPLGIWKTGRVKAAALWILERRERAIEGFREEIYYEIDCEVDTEAGRLTLRYAPPKERRITDRSVAEKLAEQLRGIQGSLQVEQAEVRRKPPRLLTKTKLLVGAGKALRTGGKKIEEAAQANYQTHLIQSYLRSSCPFISSADAENVVTIATHLSRISDLAEAARIVARGAVIRKGAVVNDKEVGLASHTAIIPTVQPAYRDRLTDMEWKVYLYVAKRYLAAFLPDGVDLQTTVQLPTGITDRGVSVVLGATGTVVKDLGWRMVYGSASDAGGDEDEAEEGTQAGGRLPPVRNGMIGRIVSQSLAVRRTTAPKRYTLLTWQAQMAAVHREVEDKTLARRLETSKGIGTESSRRELTEELVKSGLVETLTNKEDPEVCPSAEGRLFAAGMEARYPSVLLPERTALAEMDLQRIAEARDEATARRLMESWLAREADELRKAIGAVRAGGPLPLPPGFRIDAPSDSSRQRSGRGWGGTPKPKGAGKGGGRSSSGTGRSSRSNGASGGRGRPRLSVPAE